MPSPSKEENVMKLILENSPLKEWHFEEIVRGAGVTRVVASKWLRKYQNEGLIKRVNEKGRFPFYTACLGNAVYTSLKRIYALEQLHKSGLLPKLISLKSAKTIILFGSFARGDWYRGSDIDIFVLGDIPKKLRDFDRQLYEAKLKRNIELHVFHDRRELKAVKTGLVENIMNGYILKGRIQDFAEVA
jgi:predicted nucleotidyltransferase